MKQREIRDSENVQWQCVQPLSGSAKTEQLSQEILTTKDSQIEIVCTPSKGAMSVRIEVPIGWENELSDEQLLEKVKEKSNH